MNETKSWTHKDLTAGDAAVNGLFAGLLAGAAMGLVLALAGLLAGEIPAAAIARVSPLPGASTLSGVFLHLAVSGVYGALFGLGCQVSITHLLPKRLRRVSGPLAAAAAGLVYSAGLFLLAWFLFLPGLDSPLGRVPALQLALAHTVYGLSLGWAAHRFGLRLD
jgi:hypothetical protein